MPSNSEHGEQMQLWPGGRLLYIHWHDGLFVRSSREEPWATPDAKTAREVEINRLALKYQQEEIYFCDSSFITDLQSWADSGDRGGEHGGSIADEFTSDRIENLYADPTDWTLKQCRTWLEENGHDDPDQHNPYKMEVSDLVELLTGGDPDEREALAGLTILELQDRGAKSMDEELVPGIDEWRDHVKDFAEAAEIFEWWRISKWLADLFIEIGECVLKNNYGQWWGRCTTGQAYIMDGVLQKAAVRHLEKTAK